MCAGEPTREYNCHAEEKEDACDREAALGILFVDLTVYYCFTDQGNCDADCAPEKRLAATYTINHENNEDEIWGHILA
jgi:hypothetical protein